MCKLRRHKICWKKITFKTHFSDEKDDTLSAVSGGSFKPEIPIATTSLATVTTPTLNASTNNANTAQTSNLENDDSEYSVKPPNNDSWDKNGSPQKSK